MIPACVTYMACWNETTRSSPCGWGAYQIVSGWVRPKRVVRSWHSRDRGLDDIGLPCASPRCLWGQSSTHHLFSGPGNQDLQHRDEHGFLSSHTLVSSSLMVLRGRPFPSKLKKWMLLKKPLDWKTLLRIFSLCRQSTAPAGSRDLHSMKWSGELVFLVTF